MIKKRKKRTWTKLEVKINTWNANSGVTGAWLQKSLYFRPVDNDLHSDRAIGNCTRNATSCI